MARKLIARLPVRYRGGEFTVDPAYKWEAQRLYERCAALCRDGPARLTVEIYPETQSRTLDQNRLMWRLLRVMARATDGRAGTTTAEDCYIEMLEKTGARVDYLAVPLRAIPLLKQAWRVVKIIELMPGNMATVKCVEGSSRFDRDEMHDFIEALFDRLAEMDVDDAAVTDDYRAWRDEHG